MLSEHTGDIVTAVVAAPAGGEMSGLDGAVEDAVNDTVHEKL